MAKAIKNADGLKERVWARYAGICWACGLMANTKHGRLVAVEDNPRAEKMRESNLVPMHQDCALLKPHTATWREANAWRRRTRGAAGARVKTTLHLLRDILAQGCDPASVREALRTAEDEQEEWNAYCSAQATRREGGGTTSP